ncbi:MAG: hypothetical protein IPK12_16995 [Gemmatimonadetes bacterium]|nr:hypothetical protein [Gemmatimonadota bacterium]
MLNSALSGTTKSESRATVRRCSRTSAANGSYTSTLRWLPGRGSPREAATSPTAPGSTTGRRSATIRVSATAVPSLATTVSRVSAVTVPARVRRPASLSSSADQLLS